MIERYDDLTEDRHPTCPCGCGELADECARPRRRSSAKEEGR